MDNITIITWPRGRRSLMAHLLRLCLGKVWDAALATGAAAGQTPEGQTPEGEAATGGGPQVPGRSYLVEYEAFPQAVVARFESFVAKGGEDSAAAFRRFASHDFTPYDGFAALWVRSDFVGDQVVVDAAELRANALAWLPWALGVLAPGMEVSAATLARAAKASEAWAARNPAPELAAFRHYDAALFAQLAHLKLRRDVVQRVFHEVMGREPDERSMPGLQALASEAELRQILAQSGAPGQPPEAEDAGVLQAFRPALSPVEIGQTYQLFLGRNASDAEVERVVRIGHTAQSLAKVVLASPEFATKFTARQGKQGSFQSAANPAALVHLHIPKSAGTSLTSILAANFPTGRKHGLNAPDIEKFKAIPDKVRRQMRLVFGHLEHGVGQMLPQGCIYVSVLRQPGPRLLSYYRYMQRRTDHPMHRAMSAKDMSFGRFLEFCVRSSDLRAEVDNGQIRRLAGRMGSDSLGAEHAVFRTALTHVFAPDMIFGLTEHFGLLLEDLVARKLIDGYTPVVENAAPETANFEASVAALNDPQRQLLHRFTRWDQALYGICETCILGLNMDKDFTA